MSGSANRAREECTIEQVRGARGAFHTELITAIWVMRKRHDCIVHWVTGGEARGEPLRGVACAGSRATGDTRRPDDGHRKHRRDSTDGRTRVSDSARAASVNNAPACSSFVMHT